MTQMPDQMPKAVEVTQLNRKFGQITVVDKVTFDIAVYPIASFPERLWIFAAVNPGAYAVAALKSVLFKAEGLATICMAR